MATTGKPDPTFYPAEPSPQMARRAPREVLARTPIRTPIRRKVQRKVPLLGLALAAVLLTLLAGCTKVTGGGQFIADGSFDPRTQGDKVTFAFTGQPTDAEGNAKGQLTFLDQTMGVTVHADLNLTDSGSDPHEAGYLGEGTARIDVRGRGNKTSDGSIFVYVVNGHPGEPGEPDYPDYVVFFLFDDSFMPVVAWSGEVQNGNVTVH